LRLPDTAETRAFLADFAAPLADDQRPRCPEPACDLPCVVRRLARDFKLHWLCPVHEREADRPIDQARFFAWKRRALGPKDHGARVT
jgi:hypothetical protein